MSAAPDPVSTLGIVPCAVAASTAAPPPMAQGQAPSMMGTFGSSMAGSMAGSMIGNAMFGGRSSEAPAAAAAPVQAPMPSAPVCTFETRQFLECMSQSADNLDYCKSVFDQFKLCQVNAAMQQQQMVQQQM